MKLLGISSISERNMREMIQAFPELLRTVKIDDRIIERAERESEKGLKGVCFLGMGGSSIAGEYVRSLLSETSPVPLISVRDYSIPRHVDKDWVVIAVSYSGNTEETLSAYREARKRSCTIFSVTTGGELKRVSDTSYVQLIPSGLQPRAALPMLLSVTLNLTQSFLGLDHTDFNEVSRQVALSKKEWVGNLMSPETLASKLNDSVPVFFAHGHLAPVAYRAKCQINENAKYTALSWEIPEANHNEIEASASYKRFSFLPIFLESHFENKRMDQRFSATRAILSSANGLVLKIGSRDRLEEMLSLTLYLDTVSLELADLNGVDSLSVDKISELKARLGG